jgi:hypothetical protein
MKHFGLLIISIFAQAFLLSYPVQATHREVNGCGDDSGLGGLVPNQPVGVDFRPVCDNHDRCYGALGQSREHCDNEFRSGLRAKCEEELLGSVGGIFGTVFTGGGALVGCYGVAEIYYQAVRERGGKAYSTAQNHAREEQSANNRASAVGLLGIVHLQDIGDVSFQGGSFAGTRGESRRLEGFSLAIADGTPNLGIQYIAHLQDVGDSLWVDSGQFVGTRGESRRLEGFAIRLTGSAATNYNIRYICHLQDIGDTPIRSNGEFCGTQGESRRLEGLQVWIETR